ncbi:MAG TPA: ATP phosphoribosyltransferase [Thermohalobaculum sp.]|nr:ATP phosphoribosyltransferase [Thermohalobaculum sp.]
MTLALGLPSKGRLQDETVAWFAARGVEIARTGDARQYAAEARGINGLEIVLLSATEIPRELARGRLHLGVTGEDLVRERISDWQRRVALAAPLGFGHADLVVAVPAFWVDVESMADLDEVAEAFRARHGHGLRVATKYRNLVRAFFQAKGVADYRLTDSQGATEAAPKNLSAEAIADITSSGETLRANQLRVLADGLILRSEAHLCLSRAAAWGDEAREVLEALSARLGTALEL